jgi:hypothetical protein
VPNGPSAVRAYAPARTTAAEKFPRASWAFFCAAEAEAPDEDDEVDDNGVEVEEKGEAARRRRGARSVRRKVVTIMSFVVVVLPFFLRERVRGE